MMFSIPATLAQSVPDEEALPTRARAIHERVLVLDTHVDFLPSNFTAERNYTQRLDNQFNLPKMFDGGIDATFLIVYVGQTREEQSPDAFTSAGYEQAYKAAIEKFGAIHWLCTELVPDKVELAFTPHELRRIVAKAH